MPTVGPRRAAQYVRMSTEHQRFSIPFQSAVNAAFALEQGYEIVRTYDDAGISGLGLRRRLRSPAAPWRRRVGQRRVLGHTLL